MSEAIARAQAEAQFDSGQFFGQLAQRVACRTESQNPGRGAELQAYLDAQIAPALQALGFACTVHANPVVGAPPLLTAQRLEDPALPTLLFYGHGDVVRGHEGQWAEGRDPWTLTDASSRWYGRGSADLPATGRGCALTGPRSSWVRARWPISTCR